MLPYFLTTSFILFVNTSISLCGNHVSILKRNRDIEITLTGASYRRMFISIDDNPTVTISKPYLLNVRPFVETIQSTPRWALGISETETRVRKSSDFQPAREYSAELSNWRFDIDDWTSPAVARKETDGEATRSRSLLCDRFYLHL